MKIPDGTEPAQSASSTASKQNSQSPDRDEHQNQALPVQQS
ncbi:hypothetical protein [Microcoleus sp. herbarium12]